jgi:hypothetical protein
MFEVLFHMNAPTINILVCDKECKCRSLVVKLADGSVIHQTFSDMESLKAYVGLLRYAIGDIPE